MIDKVVFPFLILFLLLGCSEDRKKQPSVSGAFAKVVRTEGDNLLRITESGELIVATLSGPDTYYDYQGRAMGVQYGLAEMFAGSIGVSLRVELVNDTISLVKKLESGDVDIIAFQLPETVIRQYGLTEAGASVKSNKTSWAVSSSASDLSDALNDWYTDELLAAVTRQASSLNSQRSQVRRRVRAPFISREKGIISTYDYYFKEAAVVTGWDWRLIAAQCYQESGFDPNAVSWAGAKGLMQIMPGTADMLGLSQQDIFRPEANIAAAARLVRKLQADFAKIGNPEERIKFVLAAYNGGLGHVSDAQALTRKYGGNPYEWKDVEPYIRALSQPKYYRDPVVRYGYMIGSETSGYVSSIMERWRQYGGSVRDLRSEVYPAVSSPNGAVERKPHKRNQYSREQRILSPEEIREEANHP